MSGIFGLKLWSTNPQLLGQAEEVIKKDLFQYIELSIVPDTDSSPFLSYHLPCCIHITTDLHGVNIASQKSRVSAARQIKCCIEWADRLDARNLILHPGVGEIDDALYFLKDLEDDRILIENMPRSGLHGEKMVGYSPDQMETLMGDHFGFCLDLNHAMKASADLQVPHDILIRDFLKLQPEMFHISDGHSSSKIDEHLTIGAGDYDIPALLGYVRDSRSPVMTLETPRADLTSLSEDLINLDVIKHFRIL